MKAMILVAAVVLSVILFCSLAFAENDSRNPAGIGIDLVVYQNPVLQTTIETRYDFQNAEVSGFLVTRIDLTKIFVKVR